jgi:hypothetical protein
VLVCFLQVQTPIVVDHDKLVDLLHRWRERARTNQERRRGVGDADGSVSDSPHLA